MKIPIQRSLIAIVVCLLPFWVLAAPQEKPLVFGFLPSSSPVTLFQHFTPLVNHLSTELNRKILMETAADYPSFVKKTHNRQYDFVLTAPHFASLAIDSGKYLAPITYNKGLMADILVKQDSPVMRLKHLAGKRISMPPESAIITMAGKYYLNKQGLAASSSPRYKVTNSHNDSLHAMLSGETDAAMDSFNITYQFKKKNIPVRKIASTGMLPAMAVLIARDLPKQLRVSFPQILVQMNKQPDGFTALNKWVIAATAVRAIMNLKRQDLSLKCTRKV